MQVTVPSWIVWISQWIVSGMALALTAALVPGFRLRGFGSALIASLVIGLLNIFVRPVLVFLTFPLTLLTIGLFLIVVNAIVLRLSAALLDDFEISGWLSAILGAIVLALADSLLHALLI